MSAYLNKTGLTYLWSKIAGAFTSKADAIKSITRSGTTFTATRADNTTFTFDQSTVITESELVIVTTSSTSTIDITSLGYSPASNVLHVYVNGLKLNKLAGSSEYTATSTTITLTNAIPAGNVIDVTVTKIG